MTTPPTHRCCPVLELRQYTLRPGQRDVLIDLFDRTFIEPQEALGMHIVGQFRDLDRPDRFVWLRGFPDMETRAQALKAFYGGPVWKAHREAANATMVDSDNVLLLRPFGLGQGFALTAERPPPAAASASGAPASPLTVTVLYPREGAHVPFERVLRDEVLPALCEAGCSPLGIFETEDAPNNFPALPVRTDEHAVMWVSRDPPPARYLASVLGPILARPPELLQLEPTARSRLR